jgi:ribonuclease HI
MALLRRSTDIHWFTKMAKEIFIATDGACIGNPGPGGWACILRYKEHTKELFGSEQSTTNNRMELRALIEALVALKEPCTITVRTDSKYLRDGITTWIHNWKANGWMHKVKGQGKQPVKNRDLWEKLDELVSKHDVSWEWIKGHSIDEENLRCDLLANGAARRLSASQKA